MWGGEYLRELFFANLDFFLILFCGCFVFWVGLHWVSSIVMKGRQAKIAVGEGGELAG